MSQSSGSERELDDPGRDPAGLDPPRNPFGGGPDQDSGRGTPKGEATGTPAEPVPTDDGRAPADPGDDAGTPHEGTR